MLETQSLTEYLFSKPKSNNMCGVKNEYKGNKKIIIKKIWEDIPIKGSL